MKRIALITDRRNSQLGDVLAKDLEHVLGGRVEILSYTFDRLQPGERIEANLVLVTTQAKALEAQHHAAEARRILVLHRTIRERDACRIASIPPGTQVLVVNNLPETTMEMVSLLQQLEINHLEFIPYEPGMDTSRINIAITPGERNLIPAGIQTVLDIGHRCIDISSFIEILSHLKIVDKTIERKLLNYSRDNIDLDTGINHQYKQLFRKNMELDAAINLSHEGILLLNCEGRVSLYNHALAQMLDLPEDPADCRPDSFAPEIREILGQRDKGEWFVESKGRSIIVNRQDVKNFGERNGSYFNFQEVTYIRQMEQNLSRKLRERGLIARYSFADILSRSPRMEQCMELARRIAGSDFTVLISGESGTGKELLAQSIHNASARSRQPFVAVNCAAVPESLLESELFGYVGGSFTGALKDGKEGLFEQANNGTVFLDEIGDMPLLLQAKLLRVLQERQIMRVGAQKLIETNIRVIAATNRNLRELIQAGKFREDLYYRLNALSLAVPPLRERPEDIIPLLEHYLSEHQRDLVLSDEARDLLQRYEWPGNVRELSNVANHITLMGENPVTPKALPDYLLEENVGLFETEEATLASRCGLPRAIPVLAALAQLADGNIKAGRKSLQTVLQGRGHSLSEAEIRSILQTLKDLGLVNSSIGRRGSRLSPLGMQFVKWSQNRRAQ